MPNYVFECQDCLSKNEVFRPLSAFAEKIVHSCPFCLAETEHHLIIPKVAVEDWGNDGHGRFFEHLAPQGMSFTDKRSYNQYLKEHGLREWVPKPGMPSDGRG